MGISTVAAAKTQIIFAAGRRALLSRRIGGTHADCQRPKRQISSFAEDWLSIDDFGLGTTLLPLATRA